MINPTLVPVTGIIARITPLTEDCCGLQITIQNPDGISDFILDSSTYVIQETRLQIGMFVAAFYDADLPIPLIYPPRYRAVIIGIQSNSTTIYAGYFDENLVSADNALRLVLSSETELVSDNGQPFICYPGNQLLIVFYSASTNSIPAQTMPRKIIVLC